MADKKPKALTYKISEILKVQQQLSGPAWLDYYGIKLQGEDFEDFARCAHAEMPRVPFAAVYASLQAFAGQELTPKMGDEAAWRLAGNLPRLKKGTPVYPWKGQIEAESVPMVIERVNLATRILKRDSKEEHVRGAWVTFFILGGLPAGRRVTRFWSWKYAKSVKSLIGFSKWDRSLYTDDRTRLRTNFPLVDMRQLVQMRIFAGIEADLDPAGPKLIGDEVRATPSMIEHNHVLFRRRLRQDGFECPMAWDRECYRCPKGYETCPAACHRLDFVGRTCPACQEANQPFDPESPLTICVNCAAAKI